LISNVASDRFELHVLVYEWVECELGGPTSELKFAVSIENQKILICVGNITPQVDNANDLVSESVERDLRRAWDPLDNAIATFHLNNLCNRSYEAAMWYNLNRFVLPSVEPESVV
jgi:hypothetical protein